jgi:hypothetical protein
VIDLRGPSPPGDRTHDGPWIGRAAGNPRHSATSRAHISAAAASHELLAEDQPGTLSDAMINALKTTVGFKFTCNARTPTFLPTCNFGGATTVTGACGLADFGLSSNDSSVGIGYGSASGSLLGCAEHGIAWGRAGRVWVK